MIAGREVRRQLGVEAGRVVAGAGRRRGALVRDDAADPVGQERRAERRPAAVRVPEDRHRSARLGGHRVGDRGHVLELARDGVRLGVARRATSAPVDGVEREVAGQPWADDAERRVVGARAMDEDERRARRRSGRPRWTCRQPTGRARSGPGRSRRDQGRGGRFAAAAASRIHVAPARSASCAGHRLGSRVGPKISPRTGALSGARGDDHDLTRGPDHGRVERHALDVWLDVGRRGDGHREVGGAERRRAREDRQEVPVGPDPERAGRRRPASRRPSPRARPPAARRPSPRRTTPDPGPSRSPRRLGMGGSGRTAGARPASRPRPCLPRPGRCPRRCRRTAWRWSSGWSRGT